jgi:hypothetical protein
LKRAIIMQGLTPVAARAGAIGRVIADMLAELGNAAWMSTARASAGLDRLLDVHTTAVAAALLTRKAKKL